MKANIAVATVSGKAYYLLVSELRKKNTPFLSLMPNEPIPVEIKAVITTEKEKHLINHEKVFVYTDGADPEALIKNALQATHGKEQYERLVIGVDPGEVLGLAVLADGKVIETENCFSIGETTEKIKNILKSFENTPVTSVSVKIGDGVPTCKEELLLALNNALPQNVALESVSEAGTSRNLNDTKHRRGLRDMVSAIKIAGRNGHRFQRRREDESNC
jgi:ABC-type sugar transport system ATPase subunit